MESVKILIIDRKSSIHIKNTQMNYVLDSLKKLIKINEKWIMVEPNIENSEKFQKLSFPYTNFEEYDKNNLIEILELEKPDAIIISNDYDFFIRSFVIAAKFCKIPIILLLPVPSPSNYVDKMDLSMLKGRMVLHKTRFKDILEKFIFMLKTYRHVHYPISKIINVVLKELKISITRFQPWGEYGCDLILVTGSERKEFLERKKVNSKISVTGYLTMDEVYNDMLRLKNNNKIEKSGKIVIMTTPMVEHGLWTEKEWENTIKYSIENIKKNFEEHEIVIKIHPVGESKEKYENLIKKLNISIPILQKENLISIISNADFIITYAQSSGVLQAACLEKPVIIANFFKYSLEKMPFIKEKLAIEWKEPKKLKEAISKTEDPDYQKNLKRYISKYLYKFDGKASERSAKAIIELIKDFQN